MVSKIVVAKKTAQDGCCLYPEFFDVVFSESDGEDMEHERDYEELIDRLVEKGYQILGLADDSRQANSIADAHK